MYRSHLGHDSSLLTHDGVVATWALRPEQLVPEYVASVIVKVGALLASEVANPYARIDTPRVEELVPDVGHENEFLVHRERDVALVEQVVDVRRQQQPVGAIQTLGVGRVSPRL